MTIKFDTLCPKFHTVYKTENLDYAEKARQIICEELGFEPSLNASCIPEISLRKSLKRYANNQLTDEQINIHIDTFCNNVRLSILRNVPEQVHLVDKEAAKNYTNR